MKYLYFNDTFNKYMFFRFCDEIITTTDSWLVVVSHKKDKYLVGINAFDAISLQYIPYEELLTAHSPDKSCHELDGLLFSYRKRMNLNIKLPTESEAEFNFSTEELENMDTVTWEELDA